MTHEQDRALMNLRAAIERFTLTAEALADADAALTEAMTECARVNDPAKLMR